MPLIGFDEQLGQTEQNRTLSQAILDEINSNPIYGQAPNTTPLYQSTYGSLSDLNRDTVRQNWEPTLGWIPGLSEIPLDNAGNPLYTYPGSLYSNIASRGGMQALEGPFGLMAGLASSQLGRDLQMGNERASLEAMGISSDFYNNQFNQRMDLAQGYAGLPRVGMGSEPSEPSDLGGEFPNPFAGFDPSQGGDGQSPWPGIAGGIGGALVGGWARAGFPLPGNPFSSGTSPEGGSGGYDTPITPDTYDWGGGGFDSGGFGTNWSPSGGGGGDFTSDLGNWEWGL